MAASTSAPTAATTAVSTIAVIAAGVVVTLSRTARAVLHFGVETLRGFTRRVAGVVALLVGLSVGLTIGVLLLVIRFVFRACIYIAPPTAAIRFLPTRTGVLVDVAVVPGVHIPVGTLACCRISVRGGCAVRFAPL
jgi:hypothetical protein